MYYINNRPIHIMLMPFAEKAQLWENVQSAGIPWYRKGKKRQSFEYLIWEGKKWADKLHFVS